MRDHGPVRLSAVIITWNEERNIARCLSSLAPLADEIVVLDSGSTDATREICRRHGAVVHQRPFDDFVSQKNAALDLCSHHHVLSLDADESLSPELAAAVAGAKADWRADGYAMNRLTCYCGAWVRHGGWYPDTKLRLFDRRQGKWRGDLIHEVVAMAPGAATAHLPGDLLHYSYYTLGDHVRKLDRFTDLTALAAHRRGKRSSAPRLALLPPWKFLQKYLFQAGCLDGFAGFQIAVVSAFGVYLKYAKMRELERGGAGGFPRA